MTTPPDKRLPPQNEADPAGYCAMQAACVHLCLDERQVPRSDAEGKEYSLWGRILLYIEQQNNQDAWKSAAQTICDEFDPLKPVASPALARVIVKGAKQANADLREENKKLKEAMKLLIDDGWNTIALALDDTLHRYDIDSARHAIRAGEAALGIEERWVGTVRWLPYPPVRI